MKSIYSKSLTAEIENFISKYKIKTNGYEICKDRQSLTIDNFCEDEKLFVNILVTMDSLELTPSVEFIKTFHGKFSMSTIFWYKQNSEVIEYVVENLEKLRVLGDNIGSRFQKNIFTDSQLEKIVKALQKYGLTENTLVIFTADNGPWLNFGNHAGSAGGLREGKGCSWEGGQRVPCIMRWPGIIPAGDICNQLASSLDLLPTLVEITGGKLPSNKIDGVSILSLMLGDKDASPRHEFYYYYETNSLEAVQRDFWKLILPHKGRTYRNMKPGADGWPGPTGTETINEPQLYDLRRDPGEWYDVALYYPEKIKELQTLADKARKDLGDDLTNSPGENKRKAGTIK
jgi:hypothetical protein